METSPSPLNLFERFNNWLQESIMIKLLSIGFLLLILLIPASWIEDLMHEREKRADDAMTEVASKWSGSQTISGPVLVIPYNKTEIIERGKGEKEIIQRIQKAFFLPNELNIRGEIRPTVLHRGIFDAVVYGSTLDVRSVFTKPDFKTLSISDQDVRWNEASLIVGISDLRGIRANPEFNVGEVILASDPSSNPGISSSGKDGGPGHGTSTSSRNDHYTASGIISRLNWENADAFKGNISIKLELNGSQRLDFVPAGKTTTVSLSGNWKDPSFDGEFLPESREISDNGFTASWKVLHFNRPFSQQWVEDNQHLGGSEFGVKMLLPVDQYQKSIRTAKYASLIILLTFIALFLVEITQKVRIHPFQYILIGAALIIYYTLLISLSEHIGYNPAYIIASASTVILISLYSATFLRKAKLIMSFTTTLLVFYIFIFVIIQEQDYSLLLGSVGLFIIISLLMYFSRNVDWYKTSGQNI